MTFSSQLAAWLVERILDLLMILVIFGLALSQVGRSGLQPGPQVAIAIEVGGWMAGVVRCFQSGYLYHYALVMILGIFVLMTYFVWLNK